MSRPSPVKKNCAVAQGGARLKDRKQSARKSWNIMYEEDVKGKK